MCQLKFEEELAEQADIFLQNIYFVQKRVTLNEFVSYVIITSYFFKILLSPSFVSVTYMSLLFRLTLYNKFRIMC